MKIHLPAIAGLVLAFLLSSCSSGKKTIRRLDGSSVDKTEFTKSVNTLIQKAQVHGLGLVVFNDDRAVYEKHFGYKRRDTCSPWTDTTNIYGASLSKAVFVVLVMQLVEEGVLGLDTPLETYLDKKIYEYEPRTRWHDDYSDLRSDSLYHKITARMCLTHTAGFPNWRWIMPDRKLRVLFEPGTRYSYSGEGLTYLQVVLETMTGKNLETLAQERIFRPLGMAHSSYRWQPSFEGDFAYGHARTGAIYPKDKDNEPRGASTMETTLRDYRRFLEAVLQGKLLSAASYEELFATQVRIRSIRQFGPLSQRDSTRNDAIRLGYGLGWGVFQSPHGKGVFKEGHGDGFQHYFVLFPEAGIGILMMTNSDNGESIFKELLEISIGDVYSPTEWNNYIPYQGLSSNRPSILSRGTAPEFPGIS